MPRLSLIPPATFRNECFKINLLLFNLLDAVTRYVGSVLRLTLINYPLHVVSTEFQTSRLEARQ